MIVVVIMVTSCGTTTPVKTSSHKTSTKATTSKTSGTNGSAIAGKVYTGEASYYADKFHGRATASGEKYDKRAMTCAHRTFAFGTMLKVTNTSNGKSVKVRVNDRGPFKEGRIVDLSSAAADVIGMKQAGVVKVKVEVISVP